MEIQDTNQTEKINKDKLVNSGIQVYYLILDRFSLILAKNSWLRVGFEGFLPPMAENIILITFINYAPLIT